MRPVAFIKQVTQEVKKVEYPSKKEVMQATLLVCAAIVFFGLFFLLVDGVVLKIIQFLIKLGGK
jgi:preprotein translocase subunit SecE